MQYLIQYRRGAGSEWMTLEPGVHGAIYKKPQVKAAIEHIEANEEVIGVALQLPVKPDGFEQFNVIRVAEGNIHPHVFRTKQ
jgi:hypothetical protein